MFSQYVASNAAATAGAHDDAKASYRADRTLLRMHYSAADMAQRM